ncbi:hypothetical protein IAT38_000925 [Cryptococcus sp. DSM 104549]
MEDDARPDPDSTIELDGGIIDLREGADNSNLQLVAESINETGSAAAMAEKGRQHLYQCMQVNEGRKMALNPDRNADDLFGRGIFPECHIDEKVFMGWSRGLFKTNIRSPMPDIPHDAQPLSSSGYKGLIYHLYSHSCHPIVVALGDPGYDEHEVMVRRSVHLDAWGALSVDPPTHEPRYQAPWSRWAEQAEWRFAQDVAAYSAMDEAACVETERREQADRDHWEQMGWTKCAHRRCATWCWECIKEERREDETEYWEDLESTEEDREEAEDDDMEWLKDVHFSDDKPFLDGEERWAYFRAAVAELGVTMIRYEGESDESYLWRTEGRKLSPNETVVDES